MAKVMVRYTYEAFEDIEVEYDEAEINCLDDLTDIVNDKISDECFYDFEWEWIGEEPEMSTFPSKPPDSAWMEIDGYYWATNGMIAIRRDVSIRPLSTEDWCDGSVQPILAKILRSFTASLSLHPNEFNESIARSFLDAGAVILGERNKPGFVVLGEELVAIVMPLFFSPDRIGWQ